MIDRNNDYYLICFLDMLSISSRLMDEKSEKEVVELVHNFSEAATKANCKGLHSFTFSDNIAICRKVDSITKEILDDFCIQISRILWFYFGFSSVSGQVEMHTYMTPIRGAITYDGLEIDDSLNFILGKALVRAYTLKNHNAINRA